MSKKRRLTKSKWWLSWKWPYGTIIGRWWESTRLLPAERVSWVHLLIRLSENNKYSRYKAVLFLKQSVELGTFLHLHISWATVRRNWLEGPGYSRGEAGVGRGAEAARPQICRGAVGPRTGRVLGLAPAAPTRPAPLATRARRYRRAARGEGEAATRLGPHAALTVRLWDAATSVLAAPCWKGRH